MNKLVSASIGIEIPIDYDKEKILLPDILDLKGKRIKHITICDSLTYAPSGKVIAVPTGYLSLIEQNTKELKINNLPFDVLNDSVVNGNMFFINKIVDFTQSYVMIDSPSTYIGKSIYMVVWYDEPKIMGLIKEPIRNTVDSFEVLIPTLTQNKYLFGENRTLYNKKFQNLLLFVSDTGKTAQGNVSITDALSKKAFLTLSTGNYEFFRQVPIYLFNQNASTYPLRLQNIYFDFTNSYIEFGEITDLLTTMAIMFNCVIDDSID